MTAPLTHSRFRVTGMDCASCATKIEGAARHVAGIAGVSVSVTAGTLSLDHTPDSDLDLLQKRLSDMGYGLSPLAGREARAAQPQRAEPGHRHEHDTCCAGDPAQAPGHGDPQNHDHGHHAPHGDRDAETPAVLDLHGHTHDAGDGPFWKTAKARLTLASGAAVAGAAAVGLAFPAVKDWAFVIAMLVGLVPIARRALAATLAGMPFTIEALMTVAAVGAVLIGAAEEAAAVVFLFLVGELLEGLAAGRARDGIRALSALVPKIARREQDGGLVEVPADSLALGDTILVRPGDRIPADGTVLSGTGAVDEASVTGESTPVTKHPGDTVFAGTVNGDAALRVSVTAAAEDNTIARVVRLVEEAQEAKAPTERFIDRFSRYYTPAVVAVAALVALVPPLAFGGSVSEWVYKGLAILLIGCPCALVISTPAAIAAGLSAGARRGLLMKGGAVLENLRRVTLVCFDKTGTLTQGRPQVTDILALARPGPEVLRLAAALEAGSSHPLATAILARAAADGLNIPSAHDGRALNGSGVAGLVDGAEVFLGSPATAAERAPLSEDARRAIAALNDDGKTVSVLVVDGVAAGAIALRDEPRPDAVAALAGLKAAGIGTLMLTGDHRRVAEAVGRDLGIAVEAELKPEDKQHIVADMKTRGFVVAKVGDGINDAPALAAADVGIAMGGGTDVALETADAAVLHGRVKDVSSLIALSKRTMGNIGQNIAIALGLKAVFLVTTVAGITGLWPAILADTGATVLVTLNALRLLAWTPR